jgi:hypothetical protein
MMNRTLVTICLSFLAALGGPCVVTAVVALWTGNEHVWRMSLETLPASFMLGGLSITFWLCGPPKPTSLLETIGRWFLTLLIPVGMAFNSIFWLELIDATVNHTQLSSSQIFSIEFYSLWGLFCGLAACAVLQYRESALKMDEPKVIVSRCQCQK